MRTLQGEKCLDHSFLLRVYVASINRKHKVKLLQSLDGAWSRKLSVLVCWFENGFLDETHESAGD